MSHLLSLDPGLRNPAAALFVNGKLLAASRIKLKTAWHKLPRSERCLTVAREIRSWYGTHITEQVTKLEYCFEWPKVYRGAKSKGDPADLFPLAGVGMCFAGLMYDLVHEFKVSDYLPQEWAGSIPKTTTGDPLESIRGKRIWAKLSDEEKGTVVMSHDALDAIGIGLKYLGRYEIVRSYIGAT